MSYSITGYDDDGMAMDAVMVHSFVEVISDVV